MNKRIETKYLLLDHKLLKVEGNSLYFDNKKVGIMFTSVPAYKNDTGTAGDIAYDNTHIYICTSTNTWVRTALASW